MLGGLTYGIDFKRMTSIAREIKEVRDLDVGIAIMIGGGNIFRGVCGTEAGMDRASADQMGLLATVINGIWPSRTLWKGKASSPGTSPPSRSSPWPSRSSAGGSSAIWNKDAS